MTAVSTMASELLATWLRCVLTGFVDVREHEARVRSCGGLADLFARQIIMRVWKSFVMQRSRLDVTDRTKWVLVA